QAEDGIRDATVTGVQTCALPICENGGSSCHRSETARHHIIQCGGNEAPRALPPRRGGRSRRQVGVIGGVNLIPTRAARVRSLPRSEERRVGEGGTCRARGCE